MPLHHLVHLSYSGRFRLGMHELTSQSSEAGDTRASSGAVNSVSKQLCEVEFERESISARQKHTHRLGWQVCHLPTA